MSGSHDVATSVTVSIVSIEFLKSISICWDSLEMFSLWIESCPNRLSTPWSLSLLQSKIHVREIMFSSMMAPLHVLKSERKSCFIDKKYYQRPRLSTAPFSKLGPGFYAMRRALWSFLFRSFWPKYINFCLTSDYIELYQYLTAENSQNYATRADKLLKKTLIFWFSIRNMQRFL